MAPEPGSIPWIVEVGRFLRIDLRILCLIAVLALPGLLFWGGRRWWRRITSRLGTDDPENARYREEQDHERKKHYGFYPRHHSRRCAR